MKKILCIFLSLILVLCTGVSVSASIYVPSPPVATTLEITLSKQDIHGKELEGATITLTKEGKAEPRETWVTDGTRRTFTLDEAGTYVLEETAAPKGYKIASPITFTIDDSGFIYECSTENMTNGENLIVMVDEENVLEFSKHDREGAELKGATITLTKTSENKLLETWESDGTKHTFKLDGPGEYILEETAVPNGYIKASPITFNVDKDGKITSEDAEVKGDKENYIIMVDEECVLEFSKHDQKGAELKGATITLTKKGETAPKETWISDGTKHTFKLDVPGEYILEETNAPKGYKIASSITFEVDKDGKITSKDTEIKGDKENYIIMVDNIETPPEMPSKTPTEIPTEKKPELPDPNEPDSPDTVVIEEEGVPKTYRKVPNPDAPGEYLYMLDGDIPLAGAAPTGDYNSMIYAGIAGLSLLGVAILLKRKRMEVK